MGTNQAVKRTDAEIKALVKMTADMFIARYERNHRGPITRQTVWSRRTRARRRAKALVAWCLDEPVTEHG